MSDVFRVFAYDINTNTLLAELPANGLTFDRRLNDAGACSFTLDLLDPHAAAAAEPVLAYQGNPVALYIDRDGAIVWAGWAKTGQYKHSAHTLPVGGKEWIDYFSQRWIGAPYDQATYPSGLDPASLLNKALTDCQNTSLCGAGANVGINVVGSTSSNPWVIPSYTANTTVSQVISDVTAGLTPGTGGVDLYVDAHWSDAVGGTPVVTANIVSPRAGRVAGTTGAIIDLIYAVDYTWPTDITQGCTTLRLTGGGSGQVAPSVEQAAPNTPVGGLGQLPRLDKAVQRSNILDRNLLAQVAYGVAAEFAGAVAVPTVTLRTADPNLPLGSWIPGDDIRLFAEPHEFFPSGVDEYWRVIMHAVTVPDDGVPTVTLTFNTPPVY